MVSIYSLRSIYTFLHTIMSGNIIASFVQKRKVLRFCGWKKFFFAYVQNLETPPPPLYAIVCIWLDPSPSPLCDDYVYDSLLLFHWVVKWGTNGNTNPWHNFLWLSQELICHNIWHSGTSRISIPLEIAVGTYLYAQYGTKTTPELFCCW